MASRKPAKAPKASSPEFDLQEFLDSAGLSRTIAKYSKSAVIYSQGDPATEVLYLQQGSVKISVLSKTGKEAIVAMLGRGEFLRRRMPRRAVAADGERDGHGRDDVLVVEKGKWCRMLHNEPELSDRFKDPTCWRATSVEEDLIDQALQFERERAGAHTPADGRYGQESNARSRVVHQLSQETLAEMVGTTRSRVNFFMNKFRDLGFIEYNGGLKVKARAERGTARLVIAESSAMSLCASGSAVHSTCTAFLSLAFPHVLPAVSLIKALLKVGLHGITRRPLADLDYCWIECGAHDLCSHVRTRHPIRNWL